MRIYDLLYNQWITGRISQVYPSYRFRYTIQYANRRLVLEQRGLTYTIEIRDELQPNYVLARVHTRLSSLILSNRYDLQVYTNELPDTVYILALAAYDYNSLAGARSGGKDTAKKTTT